MRLGIVKGSVVLNVAIPEFEGMKLIVVEPITAENLARGGTAGGGKSLVVADQLSPAIGQIVGFVEGREAANPFWPKDVPVDAYCALIAENIQYKPPVRPSPAKESAPARRARKEKT